MSNLQKSKRFDLIGKFNDTSRYLDDIFNMENPAFADHIPQIPGYIHENFRLIKQKLRTKKHLS